MGSFTLELSLRIVNGIEILMSDSFVSQPDPPPPSPGKRGRAKKCRLDVVGVDMRANNLTTRTHISREVA